MKCKKYDQAWFDNKYIQILNQHCTPEKKMQKLQSLTKLAKEHNIKPQATKESKEKYLREDYGFQKTKRSMRARKARLKRKRLKRQ
ncbi:MAG: hypothetical protein OSJ70_04850 [Bacilli bacterium]|nr:hypothetical protein [Bacilli bacterium]